MMSRAIGMGLLALAVVSVADRGGSLWLAVRALLFVWCGFAAVRSGERLPFALGAGFSAIAIGGYGGLDVAVAALAFVLLALRMREVVWLCGAIGVAGAVSFGYSLWQPGWQPAFSPFHNRNHYAVFCELSLPLLAFAYRRKREAIYLTVGVVMLAAALAGGSRAGAVLLLIEVCALWIAVAGKERAWLVLPAIAVAASVFLLLAGGTRIARPFEGDHRLEIWHSGVEMVAAKPVGGWGAGEFARVYPEYARFDNGQIVNAAHSDLLEWLTEYGLAAGIGFAALFVWWLRKTIHFYPSWGILIGALHAMVDYPFHLPGLLVFAAALAGSIEANGIRTKTQSTNRKRRDSRIPST